MGRKKTQGRHPMKEYKNPHTLDGWQQWDLSGCIKLACAVAEAYGDEYRAVLYNLKRWGEDERQRSRLEQIEDMCSRSFVGSFIDVKQAFERMRKEFDHEWDKNHCRTLRTK